MPRVRKRDGPFKETSRKEYRENLNDNINMCFLKNRFKHLSFRFQVLAQHDTEFQATGHGPPARPPSPLAWLKRPPELLLRVSTLIS